jgi:hypothetical protein
MQLHVRADVDFCILLFPVTPLARRRMALHGCHSTPALSTEVRLWNVACESLFAHASSSQGVYSMESTWPWTGD